MGRVRLAPPAILFKLDLALDKLAVLAAPVINALALAAGQFNELILGHICMPDRLTQLYKKANPTPGGAGFRRRVSSNRELEEAGTDPSALYRPVAGYFQGSS